MNERPKVPDQPGLLPADIYYVLFRHKWKIIVCSLLGILGAAALFWWYPNQDSLWPLPYQSEAKLFIRYVAEAKAPIGATANDPRIKMTDDRGENVVNSELETLTSLDVAKRLCDNPANLNLVWQILGKKNVTSTNETDKAEAAGYIHNNLLTEVPKKSSIMRVVFKHKDSTVVQPVLKAYVQSYLEQHAEIHGKPGMFDDFYQKRTDELKSSLRGTESDLATAKKKEGIISIDETEKGLNDQIAKVQQQLWDAQADYAERSMSLEALSKLMPELVRNQTGGTNTLTATNSAGTNVASVPKPVPAKKVAEYRSLVKQLDDLNQRHQALVGIYSEGSKMVKVVTDQIEEKEQKKEQMEEEYPGLLTMNVAADSKNSTATDPLLNRRLDYINEQAKVIALQTKIATLTNQLGMLQSKVTAVVDLENTVNDLERDRKLKEQQLLTLEAGLDESKAAKIAEATSLSNIGLVQSPTPPGRDSSKFLKYAAIVLVGFVGLGFGLAILVEFYLDPSCRRPLEIESRLGVPLFLSIPRTKLNGSAQLKGATAGLLTSGNGSNHGADETNGTERHASVDLAPWDPRHLLQPYYEALRDRLIGFFDARNLTHKPKLVAVTSCDEGAGVTTVAAGLAASLSETGDGNVLLVDMNEEHGATHQFYKGDLACALDDALELEKRDGALVADNLYVVTEGGANDKLPRALPKRFKSLVPKLRASDYDYIIFDMPPVSQISVTPRLARFMDMVLMVVESERTDREVVKRATSLMGESKANVGIVLNKGRNYVPKRLLQDL
jgi:uncharacterized protein involved in exopolysaccharide biosynthesis/Mrp family chromosome partitioning ATPase